MQTYIEIWKAWYSGKVDSFHSYKIYNGENEISCTRQSLQLPKKICEDWANMLFNERCLISIDGEDITRDSELQNPTARYVKEIFDRNNLWARINEAQELKFSYGTVAYIPRMKGINISSDNRIIGGGTPLIDIVTADKLIPLSYDNGIIDELAVFSIKNIRGENYGYIQMFVKEGQKYVIKNCVIRLMESSYQTVDDITSINGFQGVVNQISTNSTVKPFVIDRPNIKNNIEYDSPYGVSVFANAIDSVKTCDTIFDSLMTEFSLGRTRLLASSEFLIGNNGKPVFDAKDILFQLMPRLGAESDSLKKLIETIQPSLRMSEHQQGLQVGLNIFSSQCGLGENYYRFSDENLITATQVVSEQSAAYKSKSKHEIILESALYDLIKLVIDIGINTLNVRGLNPNPEIKIKFDDSIIEDKTAMRKQDLLELSQGVLRPEEFRVKWYGETLEQAKKMVAVEESEVIDAPDKYKEIAAPTAGDLERKINTVIR